MIQHILSIGRIDHRFTVETRRWLWKPTQPLLAYRSRKDKGLRLLYYRSSTNGRVLRLGAHRWLSRRGIHGDVRPT